MTTWKIEHALGVGYVKAPDVRAAAKLFRAEEPGPIVISSGDQRWLGTTARSRRGLANVIHEAQQRYVVLLENPTPTEVWASSPTEAARTWLRRFKVCLVSAGGQNHVGAVHARLDDEK